MGEMGSLDGVFFGEGGIERSIGDEVRKVLVLLLIAAQIELEIYCPVCK